MYYCRNAWPAGCIHSYLLELLISIGTVPKYWLFWKWVIQWTLQLFFNYLHQVSETKRFAATFNVRVSSIYSLLGKLLLCLIINANVLLLVWCLVQKHQTALENVSKRWCHVQYCLVRFRCLHGWICRNCSTNSAPEWTFKHKSTFLFQIQKSMTKWKA